MLIQDASTDTSATLPSPSTRQRREVLRSALFIVIIYALFGALWILLSDRLLIWLVPASELVYWQSLKGLLYILLTAVLLFLLVRLQLLRIASALRISRDSEQRFRSMLQLAKVALIELDSTEAVQLLQEWQKQGIGDIRRACIEQPNLFAQLVARLRIIAANPEALSMLDMERRTGLAQLPAKLFPANAAMVLLDLLDAIRDNRKRFSAELKLFEASGVRREFLLDAGMPSEADDARVIISLTDGSASNRARTRQQILHQLADEVSAAPDLDSALRLTLQRLCEVGDWQLGQLWQPSPEGDVLICRELFHAASPQAETFADNSREFAFMRGRGLPGRVWGQRAPLWLRDVSLDSNFPRAKLAEQAGLRSAAALPLFRDDAVVAVLEFFSQSMRREDPALLDIMTSTCAQLDLIFKSKQQSDSLSRLARQFQLAMDTVGFGFWQWDIASGRVQWQGNVERMFGLSDGGFDGRLESYLALLPADDRQQVEAAIASALSDEATTFQVQHRLILGDGQCRWLEGRGGVFRDAQGQPIAMAGTVMDITELQLDRRLLPQLAATARERSGKRRREVMLSQLGEALGADDVLLLNQTNDGAQIIFSWRLDAGTAPALTQLSASLWQALSAQPAHHEAAARKRYPDELLFLERDSQSCLHSWLHPHDARHGIVVLLFRRRLSHPEHMLALVQLLAPHLRVAEAVAEIEPQSD